MLSQRALLTWLSLCAFGFPAGALAAIDRLRAPCKDSGAEASSSIGLRSCETLLSELRERIGGTGGHVPKLVQGYYSGRVVTALDEQGTRVQTPICDLLPGRFNQCKSEWETNHRGESCGRLMDVRVGPVIVTLDRSGDNFQREGALTRGAFIQALNHFYSEVVLEEVARAKSVRVSETCRPLAEDAAGLGARASTVSISLQGKLAGMANVENIENCEGGNAIGIHASAQSACQLVAARRAIESVFGNFLICEILARAKSGYRSVFIEGQSSIASDLEERVFKPCAKQRSSAKSCYEKGVRDYTENLLRKHWPKDGGGCGA